MKITNMKYIYMVVDEFNDISTEMFWVETVPNEIPYGAIKAMQDKLVYTNCRLVRVKTTVSL